jgi:hypothetical protein
VIKLRPIIPLLAIVAVALAIVGITVGRDVLFREEGRETCERFKTASNEFQLSIPQPYFVFSPKGKGSITLAVRYRDLAPAGALIFEHFDEKEFLRPDWSIENSEMIGPIYIDRQISEWPLRRNLDARYPNRIPMPALIHGWEAFVGCTNCSEEVHVPRLRPDAYLDYIECPRSAFHHTIPDTRLNCNVRDNYRNLHIRYHIPKTKLPLFDLYRAKVRLLVDRFVMGANACVKRDTAPPAHAGS